MPAPRLSDRLLLTVVRVHQQCTLEAREHHVTLPPLAGLMRGRDYTIVNGLAKDGIHRERAETGTGMPGVIHGDNELAEAGGGAMEQRDGDTLTTINAINVTDIETMEHGVTTMNGRTGTALGGGRIRIRIVARDLMRDTRTGAEVEVIEIREMIMVGGQRTAGGENKT